MKSDELLKFAQQLKAAREESDVSLQQIASQTRIDIKFLQAIEEGNFDVLPEIYIKAFIKEYASHINLDAEETIEKFEAAKKGKLKDKPKEETKVTEEKTGEPQTDISPKREFGSEDKTSDITLGDQKLSPKNLKLILIIVVIAVLGLIYFLFFNDSGEEIIRETPFEEILQEQEQQIQQAGDTERFEVQDEEATGQVASSSDSLNLRITAGDTCWVNVVIDKGNADSEFILYPGGSRTVKAQENFDLVLGNSGGAQIYLNNSQLEFESSPRGRKVLTINKNGIVNNSN